METAAYLQPGEDISLVKGLTEYRVTAYGVNDQRMITANDVAVERVVSDDLVSALYFATRNVGGDATHIEIWQGHRLVQIMWPDAGKARKACADMYRDQNRRSYVYDDDDDDDEWYYDENGRKRYI